MSALPSGYSLRRPTSADAEAVAAVMTAAGEGAEEVTAADVKNEWHLLETDGEVWIAESDGLVAAAAELLKRADDHVASEAYVDPEHCGRGLGSVLVALIEERAQALAPGARLTNGVLASDRAAVALLERRATSRFATSTEWRSISKNLHQRRAGLRGSSRVSSIVTMRSSFTTRPTRLSPRNGVIEGRHSTTSAGSE
jgi:ribosomal protein S18 acetylase RimI-like enzyme